MACGVKKCVKQKKYKCGVRSATLVWGDFIFEKERVGRVENGID